MSKFDSDPRDFALELVENGLVKLDSANSLAYVLGRGHLRMPEPLQRRRWVWP